MGRAAVAMVLAVGGLGWSGMARGVDAALPPGVSPDCAGSADPVARADELMNNQYLFPGHAIATLPADLTWTEDPFHDDNWKFQLHALRWALDLVAATAATGDTKYQDRALVVLQDWYDDNPRVNPPSIWSWNDHSTALRAVVYACVATLIGMPTWLHDALVLHGQTLADPSFYVNVGNHALNQSIGLLEVGHVLGRSDWMQLAASRINTLIAASVDSQGVTNEQSVGYQLYNWQRYSLARDRLLAFGFTPASAFSRIALMPNFLAMATLPNGRYEMIGDTLDVAATSIPGTWAQFAATLGASGPKPPAIFRYNAGYLFIHSGWGETRAPADETFMSAKWGAAPVVHGHADGTELTVAAWGARLLLDPGEYAYGSSVWRSFFKSHAAHNVVTVDGLTWPFATATSLLSFTVTSRYVDLRLRETGYSGVTHVRRITYSRGLGYIVVEDRLTSTTTHTYRQLWHFPVDANPAIGVASFWTQRARGNVLVRQLTGAPSLILVKGQTSPIQGWVSLTYGTKIAAPVGEAIQRGTTVRFITFILPAAGHPSAKLSGFTKTSTGYSLTTTIGIHQERLTVSGTSIWLTVVS